MNGLSLERMNGDKIRGNYFEHMVVDGENEGGLGGRVDEPQKVSLTLLKNFAEDRLALLWRKAVAISGRIADVVTCNTVSPSNTRMDSWTYQCRSGLLTASWVLVRGHR